MHECVAEQNSHVVPTQLGEFLGSSEGTTAPSTELTCCTNADRDMKLTLSLKASSFRLRMVPNKVGREKDAL